MLQIVSLLLPLLPLTFSAPAPANSPRAANLEPVAISNFVFRPSNVDFTFNDPNTKVKTTCSAPSIPTTYIACKNANVLFKFAAGDKANSFQISLKETYTSSDTYVVGFAAKDVKGYPRKFKVPVQETYPFKPFQLPEVFTFSPSGRPGSSPFSTINFTVTDVNGNGKATTKCSTQFLSNEQPSMGDIPCADSNFVFRVTDFKSIGQFTLTLSHTYQLKANSATPRITTEGAVTVDNQREDPNFRCTYGGSGVGSCGIADGKAPLTAPIRSVTGI